jgi:serine/threonine protein phosphatase PrpC
VVRAFGTTDTGRFRAANEDSFAIDERLQLLIAADGMGGHNAGEVASRLAVDTVVDHVRHDLDGGFVEVWPFGFDESLSIEANVLRTAVHVANMQVLEAALASREFAGMGTTIVAALFHHGRVSVAHVGDSRLYISSGAGLQLITRDDSWMASMLASDPQADRAALLHHPMRHALTNVVGAVARTDVHVHEEFLEGNERIVLTTDGVHGSLDNRRMSELVNAGGNPQQVASSLVEAALARGSRDNCTALAAFYSS